MRPNDTQTIALEVRGISSTLESLKASRESHDKKATERFEHIEDKLNSINEHIAASREIKKMLIEKMKEMNESITLLTAQSNKAQGGWLAIGAISTVFSIIGSALTFISFKVFK